MRELRIGVAVAVVATILLVVVSGMDIILVFLAEFLAFAVLAAKACVGAALTAAGFVGLYLLRRQSHERLRQRDGAYALQMYNLLPFQWRILNFFRGLPSPKGIYDPNSNMGHGAIIADKIYTVEPAAGWDRQLAYATEIERSNRVRAAVPGDATRALPWGVREKDRVINNAPTARLLAGAYDKPVPVQKPVDAAHMLPAPEPVTVPAQVKEWTPESAVKLSTRTKLCMGVRGDGELTWWDMRNVPHLRYHGATQGSGKTTAIQALAAGSVYTGAHLILMDRRRFKDWSAFGDRAERINTTDSTLFANALKRLFEVYQERDILLGRHGAANISELPDVPKRIVAIISEYGAVASQAESDGVGKEANYYLDQLLRQAGAAGIHIVFEDQVPDKWPKGMAGNASPVIGKMPVYAGYACGYTGRDGKGGTDTFPSYTFWYEGEFFRSLNVTPVLPSIVGRYPALAEKVIDGECSVRSVRSEALEGGIEAPGYPIRQNERTNERQNAPVWEVKDDGPTDLQAAVWAWRDGNPNGTQAKLRRDFEAKGLPIARSYANTCWHRWPGNGVTE